MPRPGFATVDPPCDPRATRNGEQQSRTLADVGTQPHPWDTLCPTRARWSGKRRALTGTHGFLPRSVVLVAPTSRSARPASFRPEIDLFGDTTRVLVEQVGAVDATRLGELVDRVSPEQRWGIDEALMTVFGLR